MKTLLGPVSFYRKTLSIALPVMAQLLVQNLVSLIDNFMVAALGDVSMSGVNVSGQLNFIFLVLINTLCMSGGIFMSQYNGAKDSDGMQQSFRYKLIVCTAAGVLYMIVSRAAPAPLLSLMVKGNAQSAQIVAEGTDFMRLVAFSWVPMVISAAIGSSLREIGKVKPPLVISIAATLVNTFLNWMLIYGNLGAPRLGVRGAAIATIIARAVEMVLFIVYIKKVQPPFYTRVRDILRVRLSLFGAIIRKSSMILVSELTWVFSETITTALYNSRGGADIVSGMAAGFAVANVFFVTFSGIYTATGVIIGGLLGADRLDEARIQKTWLLSGSIIFGAFSSVIGFLSTLLIPLVFGSLSPSAQLITRGLVLVTAVYMPLWVYLNAQFALSRTGGDTAMGVIVDISTNALVVVPGMFALTFLTPMGPVAMFGIIKLSDFMKMTIAHIWLKKERWLKNLTVA